MLALLGLSGRIPPSTPSCCRSKTSTVNCDPGSSSRLATSVLHAADTPAPASGCSESAPSTHTAIPSTADPLHNSAAPLPLYASYIPALAGPAHPQTPV